MGRWDKLERMVQAGEAQNARLDDLVFKVLKDSATIAYRWNQVEKKWYVTQMKNPTPQELPEEWGPVTP